MSTENQQTDYGRRRNDYPGSVSNDSAISKVLQNEAVRFVTFASLVIGVMGFLYTIKLDIALIKQNHLNHIEALENQQVELQKEIVELRKDQVSVQQQVLVILERIK